MTRKQGRKPSFVCLSIIFKIHVIRLYCFMNTGASRYRFDLVFIENMTAALERETSVLHVRVMILYLRKSASNETFRRLVGHIACLVEHYEKPRMRVAKPPLINIIALLGRQYATAGHSRKFHNSRH